MPFQGFPNFSTENPNFSKLFARKFQALSLAVSNEIKGLAQTPTGFAFSKPPQSSRPMPTTLGGRARRRALIFHPITAFVFPEDNVAPLQPAPAIATSPTRRGKRTRGVAASGSARLAREARSPDSTQGQSARSEGSKSGSRLGRGGDLGDRALVSQIRRPRLRPSDFRPCGAARKRTRRRIYEGASRRRAVHVAG